jgi:hypothetical protein
MDPTFALLPDELLLSVLTRLPAQMLCCVQACDRRLRGLATDPSPWQLLHRQRWTRPARDSGSPPVDNWFAEYARRHVQDAQLPAQLRALHAEAGRSDPASRAERDTLWRRLMTCGLEVYDRACVLSMRPDTDGGSAAERAEAQKVMQGINQADVRREWQALLRKAAQAETEAGAGVGVGLGAGGGTGSGARMGLGAGAGAEAAGGGAAGLLAAGGSPASIAAESGSSGEAGSSGEVGRAGAEICSGEAGSSEAMGRSGKVGRIGEVGRGGEVGRSGELGANGEVSRSGEGVRLTSSHVSIESLLSSHGSADATAAGGWAGSRNSSYSSLCDAATMPARGRAVQRKEAPVRVEDGALLLVRVTCPLYPSHASPPPRVASRHSSPKRPIPSKSGQNAQKTEKVSQL